MARALTIGKEAAGSNPARNTIKISDMATLYKANGEIRNIYPENGRKFTLEELYGLLDCELIETVSLRSFIDLLVIDEEGKFRNKRVNRNATSLAHKNCAIRPDDFIVGDALYCPYSEFE